MRTGRGGTKTRAVYDSAAGAPHAPASRSRAEIPFRADQVGSLLRPANLRPRAQAQERRDRRRSAEGGRGPPSARRCEAGSHRPAGHHRRRVPPRLVAPRLHGQLDGVTRESKPGPDVPRRSPEQPPILTVTGKYGGTRPFMVEPFSFLNSIPRARRSSVSRRRRCSTCAAGGRPSRAQAYPDIAEFWADAARRIARRSRISRPPAAPICSSTTSPSPTCAMRRSTPTAAPTATIPSRLPRTYAYRLTPRWRTPVEMNVTIHTCRGNFKSTWMAAGGYDPVAEVDLRDRRRRLLPGVRFRARGRLRAAAGFAEGQEGGAGAGHEQARRTGANDDLKRRIEEAAKLMPLEDLCLSPQCGFSSTHHGNALPWTISGASSSSWSRSRARCGAAEPQNLQLNKSMRVPNSVTASRLTDRPCERARQRRVAVGHRQRVAGDALAA